MHKLFLVVCSMCLCAPIATAQGKVDSQWSCAKATVAHNIDVGDQPTHAYSIAQFTCTATKGEIEGQKEKEGTGTGRVAQPFAFFAKAGVVQPSQRRCGT